jgi:5'-phosphate synthase pdxT subunit
MKVGVLALQGDVPEHIRAVESLLEGAPARAVRAPADLTGLDALLLPGGESTTIGRLLDDTGLREPLREEIGRGLAVLATCAGFVLLAREIEPSPGGRDPKPLGLIDVRVRRNDYGRQRESFEAPLVVEGLRGDPYPGVFIRSPRIIGVGPGATPIAWRGREVVGVRAGRLWGLTFHPELAGDPRVHEAFLAAARAPI